MSPKGRIHAKKKLAHGLGAEKENSTSFACNRRTRLLASKLAAMSDVNRVVSAPSPDPVEYVPATPVSEMSTCSTRPESTSSRNRENLISSGRSTSVDWNSKSSRTAPTIHSSVVRRCAGSRGDLGPPDFDAP